MESLDPPTPVLPENLLSGELLFDDPNSIPFVEPVNLVAVSDSMREFVTPDIRFASSSSQKLKHLLRKLVDHGYLIDGYAPRLTQTAAQTFESKMGNCLSYTNLFIALAREAGLRAEYEVIESSPIFDAIDGVLLRQHHITAWVHSHDRFSGINRQISVSFNAVELPRRDRKRIPMKLAQAFYYTNEGIQLWLGGEEAKAFAYLRRAIQLAPYQDDFWINMAVIYVDRGLAEEGKELYSIALELNPESVPAMAGVVRTAGILNDRDTYDKYVDKVVDARLANPYFHFAKAQQAVREGSLKAARDSMKRAVEVKDDDPRFYDYLGKIYTELEQPRMAEIQFKKALELSSSIGSRARINRLIRGLN